MVERTEKDLLLIEDALWRANKPVAYEAVPDLPLVLLELEAWLDDEHQWRSGRAKNWATLLNDLSAAWDKVGPVLRGRMEADVPFAREEIRLVRRDLKQSNLPPDESTRRRLKRAATAIKKQLLKDDSLKNAWADLVSAGSPALAFAASRLLAGIGEMHGHATKSLTWDLRLILGDDSFAVADAREEIVEADRPMEKAGATVSERLELAENVLTRLPRKADVVVWLRFALAPKMHPPVLRVCERVSLYDAAWLHLAEETPQHAAYPLPDELIDSRFGGVSRVIGERGKTTGDGDAVPYAAVRIELQEVWVSEAEGLARGSAEALIALASLEGGHICPWILEDSFSMFIDQGGGPASTAGPAVFQPSPQQRSAMSEDWTAEVISKNAERWGRHFPIRDHRMAEAAHLLVWLHKARGTWGPARLILCDRVIERVSGWAGFSTPRRLITEYLKFHWAMAGMRSECANVAWGALNAEDIYAPVSTPEQQKARTERREEIRWDPDLEFDLGERHWLVNPRGVLGKLDWLGERVPPGNRIAERIDELRERTQTGSAAAAWAAELMDEFSRMDARAKRVRNALVHGGPATEQAADQILPFVESLAEMALYTSVEGRLDEVDLVEHFIKMRSAHLRVLKALKDGMKPVDALWLDAGESPAQP